MIIFYIVQYTTFNMKLMYWNMKYEILFYTLWRLDYRDYIFENVH